MAKWQTERKWNHSRTETWFETYAKASGFKIKAYKEAQEFTDYRLEKEDVEIEFRIWHELPDSKKRGFECYKSVEEYFNIKKEYEELKTRFEMQNMKMTLK